MKAAPNPTQPYTVLLSGTLAFSMGRRLVMRKPKYWTQSDFRFASNRSFSLRPKVGPVQGFMPERSAHIL